MKTKPLRARFQDGGVSKLKKRKVNVNAQRGRGTLNVAGDIDGDVVYKVECALCGLTYGSDGKEVADRKCPNCQAGEVGIRYRLIARKVPADPVAGNGSSNEIRVEYDTEETAADWLGSNGPRELSRTILFLKR